ncbi:MAG: LAGLIDADG family homing endonuclease [Minisyncoccia bacterium]
MPMHRELNHDFFKKWSPEMAYVLGFFAADGSMLENKRGGKFIEFNITDQIVLYRIRTTTGSTHKITKRPSRSPKWKDIYRIQIGSKEWFADLTHLGFTQHKSNTLRFPEVPKKYLGDFIRGYFDGDGCVYLKELKYADRKNKRWIVLTLFTSGSRNFLEDLHKTLREFGVNGGSLRKKARGFDLSLSHRDSLALYRLMYHTGKASNMFLPRKREKLERAIEVLGLDK